ncbi:MAG: hypothetical protein CME68_03775 [Halobacteriovoraceae bacterium]|nr:hypothetical protein [Halobacteriovoraceae bacterium]
MNILIVEDSHTIRKELKDLLERNGHITYEAENGQEGIHFLENTKFEIDLIISDLEMPIMDGMEFIQKSRGMEKFADIPCLIYTSNIKPDLRDKLKDHGIQAILPKPLKEKHMLKIVSSIKKKL